MIFGIFVPIYTMELTRKTYGDSEIFTNFFFRLLKPDKEYVVWRRLLLVCVKNSSLNFYLCTVWTKMILFFRFKHWKKIRAKVLMSFLCRKIFIKQITIMSKKSAIFIAIASMAIICTFAAVNNTRFIAPRANHMELHCICPNIGKH